jgi:hypothetical protein
LGVEFLGSFIKKNRIYISNKTVKKMNKHLYYFQTHDVQDKDIVGMVNSYIGVFSHYRSYKIKEEMLKKTTKLLNFGYFEELYNKFIGFEDKKVELN